MKTVLYLGALLTISGANCDGTSSKPNIVFIVGDDLGWDDVSYHGSHQVQTPNIDALALSGVSFSRYYAQASCTPSRSSLLTGKYPHRLGMQGTPVVNSEDRGIPTNETLLSQYLKQLGYATHMVGKWHVGVSREEYLPHRRGFDTTFGYHGGYIDYYDFTQTEELSNGYVSGYDFFNNGEVDWTVDGYLTDVLTKRAVKVIDEHDTTKPLFLYLAHAATHSGVASSLMQAKREDVKQNSHIELGERRHFAGVLKGLDDGVGEVVTALAEKNILKNTLIVFVADNGGMTSGSHLNYGSNWPLRGLKMTPYEGGLRVAGSIWSAQIQKPYVWDGYFHVSDWLPTLLSAAGGTVPEGIDGVDQWNNILKNKKSSRSKIILEIDDYTKYYSMIDGDFKIIIGTPLQSISDHQGGTLRGVIRDPPNYLKSLTGSKTFNTLPGSRIQLTSDVVNSLRNTIKIVCENATADCYPTAEKPCLYNIKEDPCETKDISSDYPELVDSMKKQIKEEFNRRIPRVVPFVRNPLANPKFFNYTWSNWYDVGQTTLGEMKIGTKLGPNWQGLSQANWQKGSKLSHNNNFFTKL